MRFALFKGEKNVTALINRLFSIQGRGAQAATQQAAAALLKANPQLKEVSKVPVGSLIAIPDTVPPLNPGEQVFAPSLSNSFAAERVQSAFELLHQRLDEIETMAAEKIKSGMDRLQTHEMKAAVKAAAKKSPTNLADKLPNLDSVDKDPNQMLKGLQSAQDSRKQALTKMRAALTAFSKKK